MLLLQLRRRKNGQAWPKPPEAQAQNWSTGTSAAFCWPLQVTGQPTFNA